MLRIKELRKQNRITQDKLSKVLGIARSTLGMYEINKAEPDISTLIKLSEHFGVSVDYLVGKDVVTQDSTAVRIPVYDSNGDILSDDSIIYWDSVPAEWVKADEVFFGIKIAADFMAPYYLTNDLLIIKLSDDISDGRVHLIKVNNMLMIKRVYKSGSGVILQDVNNHQAPIQVDARHKITPVGTVIQLRRDENAI